MLDFGAWINEEYAVPTEEAAPLPPDEPGQAEQLNIPAPERDR